MKIQKNILIILMTILFTEFEALLGKYAGAGISWSKTKQNNPKIIDPMKSKKIKYSRLFPFIKKG